MKEDELPREIDDLVLVVFVWILGHERGRAEVGARPFDDALPGENHQLPVADVAGDPLPHRDAGRLQLVELLDRGREVGVGEQDLIALRRFDSDRECSSLAPIVRERLDADGRVTLRRGIHDQASAVGAAVIDQDELVRRVPAVEVALDLLYCAREPLLLVVTRHHDAQHGSADVTWATSEP